MTSLTAGIWPLIFNHGDTITIRAEGIPTSAQRVEAQLALINAVETQWCATVPLSLHGDGKADATHVFESAKTQSAVFVERLIIDGDSTPLADAAMSISNADGNLRRVPDVVAKRAQEIAEAQESRYMVSLGDPHTSGVKEYRVAHIVTGLLVTSSLKLPASAIFGLASRPQGMDAATLVEAAGTELGWPTRAKQPQWSDHFQRNHPVSVIAFPSVFAKSVEDVLALCRHERDVIMSVLALGRRAKGQPLVTIVEERDGDRIVGRFSFDHSGYKGNLASGFLGGESQMDLLMKYAGVDNDPLVKLCVDLFAEAVEDESKDAKFFRYWSAMETLAIARVPSGQRLPRLDGSFWPDGANTSQAEPRVYELIADRIFHGPDNIDEPSVAMPAPDLFTLIRGWYARRNATAHYGRFTPGDAAQIQAGWYSRALGTQTQEGLEDKWLQAIREVCAWVLGSEARRVGSPLI